MILILKKAPSHLVLECAGVANRLIRRLLAILVLNAASKGDICQARDIYWWLFYETSAKDRHKSLEKQIFSERGRKGIMSTKKHQDHQMYKRILGVWFEEMLNFSLKYSHILNNKFAYDSIKKASEDFYAHLENMINEEDRSEITLDTVYRWTLEYQKKHSIQL